MDFVPCGQFYVFPRAEPKGKLCKGYKPTPAEVHGMTDLYHDAFIAFTVIYDVKFSQQP